MERKGRPGELTASAVEVIPPFKIILHNDDVTPMDFVVDTLVRFFIDDRKRAVEIMLVAHNDGVALVAVMALERAEFKVEKAHERARSNGFPLTFSIEKG